MIVSDKTHRSSDVGLYTVVTHVKTCIALDRRLKKKCSFDYTAMVVIYVKMSLTRAIANHVIMEGIVLIEVSAAVLMLS